MNMEHHNDDWHDQIRVTPHHCHFSYQIACLEFFMNKPGLRVEKPMPNPLSLIRRVKKNLYNWEPREPVSAENYEVI
jgi:hypothetical protein